jgi:uncharacterized membrane protein YjjP (DUF1212 family)
MQTKGLDYPRNDSQTSADDNRLSICEFADTILEVSTLLLESGAHCERINRNIHRIARKTVYNVDMLISFTAISITVADKTNPTHVVTANRSIKHHGAHFGVLTDTSLLTWKVFDGDISFNELRQYLEELKSAPRYFIWLVRFFIGIACGCHIS